MLRRTPRITGCGETIFNVKTRDYRIPVHAMVLASGVAPQPERHQNRIRCQDCGGQLSVIMMIDGSGRILMKRPLPNHALTYADSG